jgi:hypothetical protein
MKLQAEKITDPELLFALINEMGQTFYRSLGRSGYEVVYFSGNRFARFTGKLTQEQVNRLGTIGWKVSKIEIDEKEGTLVVSQE